MAASLTQRLGWSVKPIVKRLFGDEPRTEVTGYELVIPPGSSPEEGLAVVQAAMTPAPAEQVIGWLAEMSVQVAFRKESEFTGELTLQVYARKLSEYPADVVRDVLAEWPGRSKWWPTWMELKDRLDLKVRARRVLVSRIMGHESAKKHRRIGGEPDPRVVEGLGELIDMLQQKRIDQ